MDYTEQIKALAVQWMKEDPANANDVYRWFEAFTSDFLDEACQELESEEEARQMEDLRSRRFTAEDSVRDGNGHLRSSLKPKGQ